MSKKVCIKCELNKSLKQFYRRPDNGKLQNTCISCKVKYACTYQKNGAEKRQMPLTGELLHCNKCDADKDTTEFSKRTGRPGYFQPCKACKRDYEAARRFEKINKRKRMYLREEDMYDLLAPVKLFH